MPSSAKSVCNPSSCFQFASWFPSFGRLVCSHTRGIWWGCGGGVNTVVVCASQSAWLPLLLLLLLADAAGHRRRVWKIVIVQRRSSADRRRRRLRRSRRFCSFRWKGFAIVVGVVVCNSARAGSFESCYRRPPRDRRPSKRWRRRGERTPGASVVVAGWSCQTPQKSKPHARFRKRKQLHRHTLYSFLFLLAQWSCRHNTHTHARANY